MSVVETSVRDRVALLTLNDPQRRNAMSLEMADELAAIFDALESNQEVGAVVLTGTPPAFCAGADLSQLMNADAAALRGIYRGFLRVSQSPLPSIAAVNGPAVGAGMNLALVCDLRLAGRSARFDSRFLKLALHPGGGHDWMLRQILGSQGAAALVLFGEILDGEEAARRGLAWRCVDDEALIDEALGLAARAASAPIELLSDIKTTLRQAAAVGEHGAAVEQELEPQIRSIRSPEFSDRVAALRRKISKK
jgi:enoyl-CoA hydratase